MSGKALKKPSEMGGKNHEHMENPWKNHEQLRAIEKHFFQRMNNSSEAHHSSIQQLEILLDILFAICRHMMGGLNQWEWD